MGKMVSGSQMKSFCVKLGLYNWFKSRTDSGPHQAAFDEMQGGELNFIQSHPHNVIGLLDAIIEATQESDTYWDYVPTYNDVLKVVELLWVEVEIKNALIQLKADCIAHSNQEETPPSETTIVPTVKSIQYEQGKDLVITLNQPLDNPVSVTTWLCNEGFKPENLGRSTYIDEPLKYRIQMKDKRISGTIEVRVNKDNVDFTVEVI